MPINDLVLLSKKTLLGMTAVIVTTFQFKVVFLSIIFFIIRVKALKSLPNDFRTLRKNKMESIQKVDFQGLLLFKSKCQRVLNKLVNFESPNFMISDFKLSKFLVFQLLFEKKVRKVNSKTFKIATRGVRKALFPEKHCSSFLGQ